MSLHSPKTGLYLKETIEFTRCFLLVVGMGFKIFLHATIGAGAYDARVARLAAGSEIEQVGAWIMAADPITLAASAQVAAFLD